MESAHQQNTNLSTLNVPLPVLTNTFKNYAKRANTRQDKHYLFSIVEGLGTQIMQQNRGAPGQQSGGGAITSFSMEEWMQECGVDPNWATIAA